MVRNGANGQVVVCWLVLSGLGPGGAQDVLLLTNIGYQSVSDLLRMHLYKISTISESEYQNQNIRVRISEPEYQGISESEYQNQNIRVRISELEY